MRHEEIYGPDGIMFKATIFGGLIGGLVGVLGLGTLLGRAEFRSKPKTQQVPTITYRIPSSDSQTQPYRQAMQYQDRFLGRSDGAYFIDLPEGASNASERNKLFEQIKGD